MRFLSLFSGIEAAGTAWAGLGWECVGFSEIEPFPCALLEQRFPGVPNLGDITAITESDILGLGRIDLVVFGSPCQNMSLAGKREGLNGAQSGLFFTALRIVQWARTWGDCRFALWENVPGAFSSNSGRDFASVVDALAGVAGTTVPPKGWGTEGCAVGPEAMVEWATLDAQWFGVAQRRRRVFAVADFGDWPGRPPILLESHRLRGDTAPRRETGQEVTGTLSARTKGGGGLGTDFDIAGGLVPERRPVLIEGISYSTKLHNTTNNQAGKVYAEYTTALDCNSPPPVLLSPMAVRRITPLEAERLMGFPDRWTAIDRRGKPAADGPRYKALGNSMAVPVMAWIGRQIDFTWRFF